MNPSAGDGAKPWNIPQPQPDDGTNDGTSPGGKMVEGAAEVVGGVVEGAAEVAGAGLEVAGGCLGGVADGCGGCSLAILITLFAAAGSAMAFFG